MVTSFGPEAPADSRLRYAPGRTLARYTLWLAVVLGATSAIYTAVPAVLLPNHVQTITVDDYFAGDGSEVDLTALSDLKSEVDSGDVEPTAEQRRLLDNYEDFDAARTSSLALVTTLAAIATILFGVFIGVASDRTRSRRGRRGPWILAGGVLVAAVLVGMIFTPSVALLALLWPLGIVVMGFVQAPVTATIADRVPPERVGRVSSMSGVGAFVGGVLGIVLCGLLFAVIGLGMYAVLAAALLGSAVVFVARNPDRSSLDLELPDFSLRQFLRGLLIPLRAADFRWVWVARALLFFGYTLSSALSFFMLQSYVQPAMSASEATRFVPVLGAVSAPMILLAAVFAGRLSDRVGRRKPFVIGASALMATSMLIPLVSPTVPAMVAQTVLTGLAFGVYIPVDQALVVDVLPDADGVGRDMALFGIAVSVGQVLAPALGAAVVAVTDGYRMIWACAFVLVGLAAVAILPVKKVR
jgi:MFS family permease